MKPKTKVQVRINLLSKTLRALTRDQKKWADDTLFKHYYYRTLKRNTCLECGHSWAVTSRIPLDKLLEETCPKCGTKLQWLPDRKRTHKDHAYFYNAMIIEDLQVLRYFRIKRFCKVGLKEKIEITEVAQHWIRKDGKHNVRAVSFNPMGYAMDVMWKDGLDMEIRNNHDHYFLPGIKMPGAKYLKEIRRNGFRGRLHGLHPAFLFRQILCNPKAETLLKARQYSLLNHLASGWGETEISELWPSIKICMRNNYTVKDAHTWVDHLRMLKDAFKDLLNPKYVCPADLEAEHQRLIEARNRAERRKEHERRKAEIEHDNLLFKKQKARFFGINLTDGRINIVVLEDVNEFFNEGLSLNHCVFQSAYYKNPNTLILSARKRDGQRLATIELSLKEWRVLQCRGKSNKTPENKEEIIRLVENNIDEFKKRIRIHRKQECLNIAS